MSGRLFLVPNTLDFGVTGTGLPPDLQEVLPLGVIRIAAQLGFWVAENAKTTRAFLKRVDAVVPLAQPLQSVQIVELPRLQKGAQPTGAIASESMLTPAMQGHDIGLISEAGLPAVADPGAGLVAAAHALGIQVVTFHRKFFQLGPEVFEIQTEIEQRSDRHVARDAGEAIEIQRSHTKGY